MVVDNLGFGGEYVGLGGFYGWILCQIAPRGGRKAYRILRTHRRTHTVAPAALGSSFIFYWIILDLLFVKSVAFHSLIPTDPYYWLTGPISLYSNKLKLSKLAISRDFCWFVVCYEGFFPRRCGRGKLERGNSLPISSSREIPKASANLTRVFFSGFFVLPVSINWIIP